MMMGGSVGGGVSAPGPTGRLQAVNKTRIKARVSIFFMVSLRYLRTILCLYIIAQMIKK
jgi:hypothetical protein